MERGFIGELFPTLPKTTTAAWNVNRTSTVTIADIIKEQQEAERRKRTPA